MINRIYRIMKVGDSSCSWRAECKSPVVLSPNSVNSVNTVSKTEERIRAELVKMVEAL
jgi:hypothetical protein